jgi:anti-anti-sigma factor
MNVSRKVFEVERQGNTLIVIPKGETLGASEGGLEREIDSLYRMLSDPKTVNLVVDVGSAPYFGSMIIGTIITLCKKVSDEGGQAVLCNASPGMYDAIKTMKLDTVVPYYATRAEAVQAVSRVES